MEVLIYIQDKFTHSINFPNDVVYYKLAFIQWYKPVNLANMKFHFGSENNANIELWSTKFYSIKCECIILIYNIFD